ncbi:MAG: hypothetical protein ABSA52_21230 [Candidatus Binatia bacterium]
MCRYGRLAREVRTYKEPLPEDCARFLEQWQRYTEKEQADLNAVWGWGWDATTYDPGGDVWAQCQSEAATCPIRCAAHLPPWPTALDREHERQCREEWCPQWGSPACSAVTSLRLDRLSRIAGAAEIMMEYDGQRRSLQELNTLQGIEEQLWELNH